MLNKNISKTIGIIGSRRRDSNTDFMLTRQAFLEIYRNGDTICSGLCSKGGDRFAVILSEQFKTKTLWFPADWKKYGKAAGFVRNSEIAANSNILIACVVEDRTGGTEDTIKKYLKLGKNQLILV